MENTSKSPLKNSLKEHDKAVIGVVNTYNKGHMKGPWTNHVYKNNNSAAASASSKDNGYANMSGFSWPPRLYVCSFCKREFRSAQALGGHMNVHRRDRARLRQSPPSTLSHPMDQLVEGDSINLVPSPSTNPNPNLAWMIKNHPNKTARIPSLNSSSKLLISSFGASSTASGLKRWSTSITNTFRTSATTTPPNLFDVGNNEPHNTFPEVSFNKALETGGLLRLGYGAGKWRKEDVDLELRLGYSS
ncbi:unnamed protein product [Rhodiola kirilowii]